MTNGLTLEFLSAGDFDKAYGVSAWSREREGTPDVERVRAFLEDANTCALAAYIDGEPVGLVVGYRLRRLDGDPDELFVHGVDVVESRRRQGIGRAMIEHLTESLAEFGFGEMWLITEDDNLPALALYDGTGGIRETENSVVFQWQAQAGVPAMRTPQI